MQRQIFVTSTRYMIRCKNETLNHHKILFRGVNDSIRCIEDCFSYARKYSLYSRNYFKVLCSLMQCWMRFLLSLPIILREWLNRFLLATYQEETMKLSSFPRVGREYPGTRIIENNGRHLVALLSQASDPYQVYTACDYLGSLCMSK